MGADSFRKYILDLCKEADAQKNKKFVLFILGAGHGFVEYGFQTLAANKYDVSTDFYELINVERNMRIACECHSNLYAVVHYAACRDVIKESETYKLTNKSLSRSQLSFPPRQQVCKETKQQKSLNN